MTKGEVFKIHQIDAQLLNWINEQKIGDCIGLVHSIFNKVINFITIDEKVFFSLASPEVVQSPKMMKVCHDHDFSYAKSTVDQKINVYKVGLKLIKIGSTLWDFSTANIWGRDLGSLPYVSNKLDKKNLFKLNHFIIKNGVQGGMLLPWRDYMNEIAEEPNEDIYYSLHLKNIRNFESEIKSKSPLKSLLQFVGLGTGLTPSGDDFLTGVFATWQYFHFPLIEEIMKCRTSLLKEIKKRTTVVSYFMLENCLNGYVNESLLCLIENLSELTEKEFWSVLNIGGTSGTDMLTGVSFACEQLLDFSKEVK